MKAQNQSQPHRHHSEDNHASDRADAGGHDTHGHGNHNGFETAGDQQSETGHDDHGAPGHEGHAGHDKHAGHSVEMFRSKFWICLVLMVPALIWEPMLQVWFNYRAPVFPGSDWVPAVFGTLVFIYGGWVFLQGAIRELADRLPGMMTLISLAISVAFVYSAATTLGFPGHALWWELATLVTIMLLGHWVEMRSIYQAQGALNELAKLLPDMALRLLDDGHTEEIPIGRLREGDRVLVRPGAAIPADGVVRKGDSAVNEAMITGESQPVRKTQGDKVIAGTVNGQGSLRVAVEGTGEKTALAGIMRMVSQAQTSRSRSQVLADRAALVLTVVAIGSAAVTFVVWIALSASLDFTISRTVTVLVIACPHALGLAVPLVVAISTTLGARNGLLVRDRRGLEEARNLNVVVFDKTGTLTLGEHRVVETAVAEDFAPDEALRLAAAVERDSEHPIARALVASVEEKDIAMPAAEGFEAVAGQGVRAVVEGRELQVGGPTLLRALGIEPDEALRAAADRFGQNGQAAVYLVEGRRLLAAFAIADAVRPESREAVERLQQENITVAMLTGDSKAVAHSVADALGIDTVFAEVLPEDKAEIIKSLQQKAKRVAMVGDGVNDAPALVTADVGIAIGAGTDVAVEAGDIVLVRNDPRDVPRIVALSRATYRKMVQNLWWAAGYNVVAIPLAAGVLAWAGIILVPAVGAVLMSVNTVVVAINAQFLRRVAL